MGCVGVCDVVFCAICSLLMFVSDASVCHTMEAYSSMGLVIALYVASIVSFCFPHVVALTALSIYIVGFACFCFCAFYVSFGSSVSPSILGLCSWGSGVSSYTSSLRDNVCLLTQIYTFQNRAIFTEVIRNGLRLGVW